MAFGSLLERLLRIAAATPYNWTLPAADAPGYLKSDGAGVISLEAFYVNQNTTVTGNQNNFALTAARYLQLRCTNATLLTFTGFVAGADGDIVEVISLGAGHIEFAHASGSSSAGNKFQNYATSGKTTLAAGVGTALFKYDATSAVWRLVQHEQGAYITPTYSAGDYTADSSTWGVDAGDVDTYAYYLRGRQMTVQFRIAGTDVGAGNSVLRIAIPGGFTMAKNLRTGTIVVDNAAGGEVNGQIRSDATVAYIGCMRSGGAGWTNTAADNTAVQGVVTFEVA